MKPEQPFSFSKDVSINLISQILVFAFSSASSIIIARLLGPEGKGIYAIALTIPMLIATFINMGIDNSNIYFIGKKKYPINTITGNVFTFSFISGSITMLCAIFSAPLLSTIFLRGIPLKYLYLSLTMIPLLLVFENIYYIFVGYRQVFNAAKINLFRAAAYLIVLIATHYLFGLNIYKAIITYISALLICVLLGLYFFYKNGFLNNLRLNKILFIESLRFGIKQHVGTISQYLNYRLDFLIVSALLSPAYVGFYATAVLVGETIWYISKAVAWILFPKVASSDTQSANRFTPLICRNTIFITLVCALILYSVSGFIIPWLFTPRFIHSIMALKILLPGIFFFGISRILGSDLSGRGKPQYSTIAAIISLVLTIILDFLLIPLFGINGASLASSVAYTVNALVMIYFFKKYTGVKISETLIFKLKDLAIYQTALKTLIFNRSS